MYLVTVWDMYTRPKLKKSVEQSAAGGHVQIRAVPRLPWVLAELSKSFLNKVLLMKWIRANFRRDPYQHHIAHDSSPKFMHPWLRLMLPVGTAPPSQCQLWSPMRLRKKENSGCRLNQNGRCS